MPYNDQLKQHIRPLAQQDFIMLMSEVNRLLDAGETVVCKLGQGRADTIRRVDIIFAERHTSSLVNRLSAVVVAWASAQPQVLSREGIRETLIDELWASLESLLCFLIQLEGPVEAYNRSKALHCIDSLRTINKIL